VGNECAALWGLTRVLYSSLLYLLVYGYKYSPQQRDAVFAGAASVAVWCVYACTCEALPSPLLCLPLPYVLTQQCYVCSIVGKWTFFLLLP
jgi:hypothetical protein